MTTPDPNREAFEAWARSLPDKPNITREGDGYRYAYADFLWYAWQAAMAHKGAAQNRPESAQTRMDAGSEVLPNQAYRMLIPDVDIIRPDDEYLSDDTTTWKPVGRSIFVGMPHVRAFKPGRRKIEGST